VFYNIFADDFPAGISGLGAFIPRIINDVELEIASSLLNIQRPVAILSGNIGVLARRAHMTMPVFPRLTHQMRLMISIFSIFVVTMLFLSCHLS